MSNGFATPACMAKMKDGRIERTFAWFIRTSKDVEEFASTEDLSGKAYTAKVTKWVKWAVVHIYTVDGKQIVHLLDTYWRKPTPENLKRHRLPDMRRRKVTKTADGEVRGKHVCRGLHVARVKMEKGALTIPASELPTPDSAARAERKSDE